MGANDAIESVYDLEDEIVRHESPMYDGEQLKQILSTLNVNPETVRFLPGGIDNFDQEVVAFSPNTVQEVGKDEVIRHVRTNYNRWFLPQEAKNRLKRFLESKGESVLELISSAPLPTAYGDWTVVAFGDKTDGCVHHALVYGDLDKIDFSGKNVLVRGHSACHTNENLNAINCECRKELHFTMQEIKEEGMGVILYLQQEGRGNGVVGKLDQLQKMFKWEDGKIVQSQDEDGSVIDTIQAYELSGYPTEQRDFGIMGEMLKFLGVEVVRLITNNRHKIEGVESAGIHVNPVEIFIEPDNQIIAADLKAKADSTHYTAFYKGEGNGIVVKPVSEQDILEKGNGHDVQ
ncbi:MAG: hypothetical protein ABI425_04570 [Patescibacteria group bacterium]